MERDVLAIIRICKTRASTLQTVLDHRGISLSCKLQEARRLPFLGALRFEVCCVEFLLEHTARDCGPINGKDLAARWWGLIV